MPLIVTSPRPLDWPRLARASRPVVVVLAVILVAYFSVRVARQTARGVGGDWGVYYRAGTAFLAGDPLYTLDHGPLLTFKYAPAVAMATAPLAFLPPVLARLIWFAADLAALAFLCRAALWLLPFLPIPPGEGQREVAAGGAPSPGWIVPIALALSLRYLMNQWHAGSTATIWIALTVGACVALRSGRPKLAGCALAAAFMCKLVPLCFLPLLAMDRRRVPAVGGFAAGVVGLAMAPAVWLGWSANLALLRTWPTHLFATETPAQVWRVQNQSVYAQLARFLAETPYGVNVTNWSLAEVRIAWLAASLCAAAGLYAWIIWQRRRTGQLASAATVAMLLIYMTLFNPLAWRYNFVALVVPYVVVLSAAVRDRRRRPLLIGLVAAAWLLGSLPPEDSGWPGIVTLHALGARLWGTALLGVAIGLTVPRREEGAGEGYRVVGPFKVVPATPRSARETVPATPPLVKAG